MQQIQIQHCRCRAASHLPTLGDWSSCSPAGTTADLLLALTSLLARSAPLEGAKPGFQRGIVVMSFVAIELLLNILKCEGKQLFLSFLSFIDKC